MHCHHLHIAFALTLFIFMGQAFPSFTDVTAVLARRNQVCANAPKTVAGTFFAPRSLNTDAIKPRFKPLDRQKVVWCALRSTTFVIISATQTIPGDAVYQMLVEAALDQLGQLERDGDSIVRTGTYDRAGQGNLVLRIWNTNNHQLTRGVLGAALDALADFVDTYWGGALQFYIWDGQHEVAQGLLGLGG